MTPVVTDKATVSPTPPENRSSRVLLGEAVEHAKGYVAAEKDALTLRLQLSVAIARNAAIFGIVAVVLALFGFGWLLVAVVGALAHVIGHTFAALAFGLVLLLAGYFCVRRVTGALSSLKDLGR